MCTYSAHKGGSEADVSCGLEPHPRPRHAYAPGAGGTAGGHGRAPQSWRGWGGFTQRRRWEWSTWSRRGGGDSFTRGCTLTQRGRWWGIFGTRWCWGILRWRGIYSRFIRIETKLLLLCLLLVTRFTFFIAPVPAPGYCMQII